MSYPLTVLPDVEADMTDAYRWYEERRPGLGRDFLQRIDEVFPRKSNSPELYSLTHKTVRQALVTQFPYVVCYIWDDHQIEVVAVFHGHRDPTSWRSRID